jgi:ABC-type phosphate transport system, periplasmic component
MQKVCDALGEAFKKKYPNVTFLKDGTGSGEAAAAVTNGTAQIGDLSRALKDTETPDAFTATTIAIDGIAVVVNPANKVTNLTKDQITKIFNGTITDWKDVGGDAGKITVIGREAASGTRDGFESFAGIKDKAKYAAEVTSTGEVITKVASDKLAIGYASLDSVDKTVAATKVEGIAPSEATILDKTYLIQRPFVQIYKKGSTDPIVKAWFDFIASADGQQVIQKAGLVLPKK